MKNLINIRENLSYTLKLDLKMKLTIYLFLFSLFQIYANTYSQNTKISLNLKDTSVENVLQEIESSTDFKVLYNSDEVDYKRKVTVVFKDVKIFKILDKLFANTKTDYKVVDKQIVLVSNSNKTSTNLDHNSINKAAPKVVYVIGVVKDANGPIAGASVVVKGGDGGTMTDFDGNYRIEIKNAETDVLVFSYLGYKTQEVAVKNKNVVNVVLESDVTSLNELVLTGYGAQKKSDITGAIAQLKAKSFEDQPVTRVEQALQGRVAGVSVSRSNGAPGADAKIRIRGVNSITGNNSPLVIIDGVFGGNLRTINPDDIASFEVLKDSSATAQYGSRGSNGVILVTTKKGKGKTKINVNVFGSVSERLRSIDNRLSSGQAAQLALDNGNTNFTQESVNNLFANPIDYEDEIFRTAIGQTAQVSISGGDDNMDYFISGNYTDQEGILETNEYERYSLRTNVNAKINDKLKIGLNLFGSRETDVNNPNQFRKVGGDLILKALAFDPTTPLRDDNGEFNLQSINNLGISNSVNNPVATLLQSTRKRIADRFNANLNFGYDISEGLSYKAIVGLSTLNQNTQSVLFQLDKTANYQNINTTNHQISNIINYNKSIDNHNITLTGVYEVQGTRTENNAVNVESIERDNFFIVDDGDVSAENYSNSGNNFLIQSYMARAAYDFNKTVFFTGSLRIDQSSKFSKDNRTGYFPSVGLAYSFNKLSFIENSDVVNNLKLRASWGQIGNQNLPASASLTLFEAPPGGNNFLNLGGEENFLPVLITSQDGNPDLKWETTTQLDLGLDVAFLNNRINLSLDVYKKDTEDLLLRQDKANGRSEFFNGGAVENKGLDLSLSGDVINSNSFKWNAALAFSYNENKVTKLIDGLDRILGNSRSPQGGSTIPLNIIEKGAPIGSFYGYKYLGINDGTVTVPNRPDGSPVAALGEEMYEVDEDGNLKPQIIGNGTPKYTWGLNNTFNYKNWDLNVFIQAAHGFDVYNVVQAALQGNVAPFGGNLTTSALNAYSATNTNTNIPSLSTSNAQIASSRFVEDGSFVRLSNITMGYTIQKPIKGVNSLKIYASGQNLFLLTNYTGYDPEVSSSVGKRNNSVSVDENPDVGAGIDVGAVPNPRIITLGIKVGF